MTVEIRLVSNAIFILISETNDFVDTFSFLDSFPLRILNSGILWEDYDQSHQLISLGIRRNFFCRKFTKLI